MYTALQEQITTLTATVGDLRSQIVERDLNVPPVSNTTGKATRRKKTPAWYEKVEKKRLPAERRALKLLNVRTPCQIGRYTHMN